MFLCGSWHRLNRKIVLKYLTIVCFTSYLVKIIGVVPILKNISPVLAFLNRWTQVALKRIFPLGTITEICTITILLRLHPGKLKLGIGN